MTSRGRDGSLACAFDRHPPGPPLAPCTVLVDSTRHFLCCCMQVDFGHRTSSLNLRSIFLDVSFRISYAARAHAQCYAPAATALAYPAGRPHQLAGQRYCGRGERHGSQYALPVVIDCHPSLHRRWRPGYRQCVNANCQKQAEHIKCSLAELER